MRFRPRSRIANTFLQIVPWINFVVIVALFMSISGRMTLQPGVQFELPQAPFHEGMQRGPTVVMINVQRAGGPETLIFFDDVRYQPEVPEQRAQLQAELAQAALRPNGHQVLLLADRHVSHGAVIELVNLIRAAGVQRVNVSVKPET